MIKGKRLASNFRKQDRLIIKRTSKHYWITDTYILVRLLLKEGFNFIQKWNNYKTTKDIPQIKEGDIYKITSRKKEFLKDDDPIGCLIGAAYPNLKKTHITDITYISGDKLYRVYQYGDNEHGIFDHKYSPIINALEFDRVVVQGPMKAVIFMDKKQKIKGMVMPIRTQNCDYYKEVQKIAG